MRGSGHPVIAVGLGLLLGLASTAVLGMESSDLARSENTQPVLTLVDDGEARELSLRDIERLDLYAAELEHFEGLTGVFTGVRLGAFIREFGLDDARRLRLIAADHYTVFLEPEKIRERGFLLVTRFNGDPLPRTELGPLLLIVPDEADAVLAGATHPTEWIWSIVEIRAQ